MANLAAGSITVVPAVIVHRNYCLTQRAFRPFCGKGSAYLRASNESGSEDSTGPPSFA